MTLNELMNCLEMLRELGHGEAKIYIGDRDEAIPGEEPIFNFKACLDCVESGEACSDIPGVCRGTQVPVVLIAWDPRAMCVDFTGYMNVEDEEA